MGFNLFFKRHPELSLKQPESTSLARATGFNKVRVNKFFDLLKQIISDSNIAPDKIFNMDETGMSTVQRSQKIITQKGVKQVEKISSAERGKTVTAICCMNSSGFYVLPIFIFPRKRLAVALMNDAPQGAKGCTTNSGWTEGQIFYEWLVHFQNHVKVSPQQKCLIILDNHSSHVYLPGINFARRNGIEFLTIPPHTLHRLQPLDRTFFAPLKTFYSQEAEKRMINHPGQRTTEFQVSRLFRRAYERAATMLNSVSGFRSTRILPYKPNVFKKEDFSLAMDTEIAREAHDTDGTTSPSQRVIALADDEQSFFSDDTISTRTSTEVNHLQVHKSNELSDSTAASDVLQQALEDQSISYQFEDISPLPSAKLTQRRRKAKQATHVTGSPFKKSITTKVGGAAFKKLKYAKKVQAANKARKTNKKNYKCLLCLQPYEEPLTEDWIQYSNCLLWCHNRCSDYGGQGFFVCDFCRK